MLATAPELGTPGFGAVQAYDPPTLARSLLTVEAMRGARRHAERRAAAEQAHREATRRILGRG